METAKNNGRMLDQLSSVDHYVLHVSIHDGAGSSGLTLVEMAQLADSVPVASIS
jgi:hypothetical protein